MKSFTSLIFIFSLIIVHGQAQRGWRFFEGFSVTELMVSGQMVISLDMHILLEILANMTECTVFSIWLRKRSLKR